MGVIYTALKLVCQVFLTKLIQIGGLFVKNRDLAEVLAYRKSIGRNQVLRLKGFDSDLKYKLSSSMVEPVENTGTVLMRLAALNQDGLVRKLMTFDNFYYEFDENLTSETVLSYIESNGFPEYIISDFKGLLRAKNSKKRLRKILFLSYYGLINSFGDL